MEMLSPSFFKVATAVRVLYETMKLLAMLAYSPDTYPSISPWGENGKQVEDEEVPRQGDPLHHHSLLSFLPTVIVCRRRQQTH